MPVCIAKLLLSSFGTLCINVNSDEQLENRDKKMSGFDELTIGKMTTFGLLLGYFF